MLTPDDDRLAAQFHHLAVGHHDLQTADVPPHRAVLQPPRSGGVDGDHAADRGHRRVGRIGTEEAAVTPQVGVEPLVDNARLHADRLRFDADHAPQVLGEIDDQSRPQRFAGHAAAAAAGVERDVFFGGILHAGGHVGRRCADAPRPAAGSRRCCRRWRRAGRTDRRSARRRRSARGDLPGFSRAGDRVRAWEAAGSREQESSSTPPGSLLPAPCSIVGLRKSTSSTRPASTSRCGNGPSWPT